MRLLKKQGTPVNPANPVNPVQTGGRAAFTFFELLVVISMLSVLLAIILPVIQSVRTATLKKRARAEATALAQAAIHYKAEYGFWPGQAVYDTPTTVKGHPDLPLNQMVGMIAVGPETFTSRIDVKSSSGTPDFLRLNSNEVYQAFSTVAYPVGTGYEPNPLNPKGIQFLDLTNETDFRYVSYPDPWGQPYRMIMGLNPRSTFSFHVYRNNNPDERLYEVSVSNVTAFAFSLGPNSTFSTNYIYSAGVGP